MGQKVVTNDGRTLFYCWRWGRFVTLRKISRCFTAGCRRMYVPAGEHLRKRRLGVGR